MDPQPRRALSMVLFIGALVALTGVGISDFFLHSIGLGLLLAGICIGLNIAASVTGGWPWPRRAKPDDAV